MKHYYSILVLFLMLTLAACGGSPSPEPERPEQPSEDISSSIELEPELQKAEFTPTVPAPAVEEVTPAVETVTQEAEAALPDSAEEVNPDPSETAQPVDGVSDEPTAVDASAQGAETPQADSIVVNWLTVEGKTSDNLAYLGNPDAPITIIDYSDFL
ncbi:MAG: hypothetical protein OES12_10250 [Anaerolineae bacterium]|nr:hypothetical protein [Anaerolineae bacterium]